MNNLFGYEFRRLYKSVSFYVCMILMGAFSVMSILTKGIMYQMMIGDVSSYVNGNSGLFDAISGGKLGLMLPIFLSIFICGEYADGTIKNVVGHGTSRTKLFFGRYFICIASVFVMSLFLMLCGWLTGIIYTGIGYGYGGKYFLTILIQLLSVCAYATVFYFIAVAVRKAGLSILIGIFAPALISLALTIVDMFNDLPVTLSEWTVSGAFDMVNSGTIVTEADMIEVLIVCAVHIAAFLVLGWVIAKKQEV